MTKTKTDKNHQLLDKLHAVLEKQIKMARKGDLTAVEELTPKADEIIKEISGSLDLVQIQQTDNFKRLEKIYRQLSLTLASQKYSIQQQIQQIREGRKTLQAYKINS
jgi:flagellin-specific chaperone FliS